MNNTSLDFTDRVAIVTGAGAGLGRSHALELARRGARVVVNDLGTSVAGVGRSSAAAEAVVAEIRSAGGEALASAADVTSPAEVATMVEETLARWGRVDVLINNAGFLRDRSFAKQSLEDFRTLLDVHLMGAVICTRSVWETMMRQRYGRVLMTTSAAGLYGHFGQSAYGAAKLALVGLMNVLRLEGERHDIRVNAIAPAAATRMVGDAAPAALRAALPPERVTAAAVFLVGADAPTGVVIAAGGGSFTRVRIGETAPVRLGRDTADAGQLELAWPAVRDAPVTATHDRAQGQIDVLVGGDR